MSLRHSGLWHYEFIPDREAGHQWRVADEEDDVITDFATENQAARHVRTHNAKLKQNLAWKYE